MIKITVLAVALIFLMSVCGIGLATSISIDPAAMPGWSGTVNFFGTDGTNVLDVDIEYAVYNLGAYPGSDPSGGTKLIYAYQIFNNINPVSVNVTNFTVKLIPGSSHYTINDDPGYGILGGVAPIVSGFTATSAAWNFLGNTVDYGEYSTVLFFTSLDIPVMDSAQVDDSGISAAGQLPTPSGVPIPEPSIIVSVLGGILLMARKKK